MFRMSSTCCQLTSKQVDELTRSFALSLNKIGCTSVIKMKVLRLSFCITLGFNKILTLGSENKFSLLSLNRIFALSLHSI